MDPTDAELYSMLLEQLTEVGEVIEDRDAGVLHVSGMPDQRVTPVRLHLTPELLGRALRDLAPDYAEQFPLLKPLEAALVVFWLHVLAAVEEAGPGPATSSCARPGSMLHPCPGDSRSTVANRQHSLTESLRVVSRGRHPKAPVAEALSDAVDEGFEVEEMHRGHRWGVAVCPSCGSRLGVWSTPRVPEHLARQVRRFVVKHRRCV